MARSTMKLYPFDECAKQAAHYVNVMGAELHQQFNCSGCGVKQTMEVPNKMFTTGKCEECGHITDIRRDGCNYMLGFGIGAHDRAKG